MTWLVVAGVLIAGVAVAFVVLRPSTRVPDPAQAKSAGDELTSLRGKTVVAVTAHPDDAEWWAGGTLAMLSRENTVVLVLGTSGDAGNGGNQAGLGELREDLQRTTADILGYSDVVYLRHPDGHLAEAKEYPGEIEDLLGRLKPDAVLTFDVEKEGPFYHHEDHRAAGRAALAAVRTLGGPVMYLQHTGAPDVLVDYAPVRQVKQDALSIQWSYHDSAPLGFVTKWMRDSGLESSAERFGSGTAYPEVGVESGEQFRRYTP